MSLSRIGKSLLLSVTLLVTPMAAFAQVSAIRGGVESAATAANLSRSSCRGTACVIGIISNVVTVAIQFSGVLLLCYLLYAGFLWMTAPDSKQVGQAQDMIKNAVAGLLLVVVSFAISSFVLEQLETVITGERPAPAAGAEGAGAGGGAVTP